MSLAYGELITPPCYSIARRGYADAGYTRQLLSLLGGARGGELKNLETLKDDGRSADKRVREPAMLESGIISEATRKRISDARSVLAQERPGIMG